MRTIYQPLQPPAALQAGQVAGFGQVWGWPLVGKLGAEVFTMLNHYISAGNSKIVRGGRGTSKIVVLIGYRCNAGQTKIPPQSNGIRTLMRT